VFGIDGDRHGLEPCTPAWQDPSGRLVYVPVYGPSVLFRQIDELGPEAVGFSFNYLANLLEVVDLAKASRPESRLDWSLLEVTAPPLWPTSSLPRSPVRPRYAGEMQLDRAMEFLAVHHHAVLATRRADGSVQMSPVLCAVEEARRVVVSTRQTARKTHHVQRDPFVALCVMPDEFFGPWIQIEGSAEVVEQPEAMERLVAYYRAVSGEHPNWDDYRKAMRDERRVLLAITLERAGPDLQG